MPPPSAHQRPQWQLQILAAQKHNDEIRKAEEQREVAKYFEKSTNRSKYYEQWSTKDYYERAQKEADMLSKKKLKAIQLEERRKKLELMLFQENMQYEQELKTLDKQPKFYKNGSYLNNIPTSMLKDINQGIMAKEEQLRKHEAELRLHHAWRLRQPELRAASSYIANGKLKSAWMEQIVEKEVQKKKEEEESRKILKERDEQLRKQIQIEKERLREKEQQMRELRNSLEGQIAELGEKESIVKTLRKQEERERLILDELQLIASEREKELQKLIAERDATIVNMGLHKYKLKKKVISIVKEIELDLIMLEKIRRAVEKACEDEKMKNFMYKRVLDEAFLELEEHRKREQLREKNIEAMYDGEARQINEKQDKLWAKEREARAILMKDVLSTLKRQVEEKMEASREQQRQNVLEREQILQQMENFHHEVKAREKDSQLTSAAYSSMSVLQSQLNSLQLQQKQLDAAAEREDAIREAAANEQKIRQEIGRMQREGHVQAWT